MRVWAVALALLVVGLVAGAGVGSQAFPRVLTETITVTETSRDTVTETLTQTRYSTVTSLSVSTELKTVTETMTETTETVVYETVTMIVSVTRTKTQVVEVTITVYPTGPGETLMTDRGSGDKNTRPFTLNETADLRIEVTLRGDPEYAALTWRLIPVGAEPWEAIADGSIDRDVGEFQFYAYQVPPGNYYINILSANVKWTIKVIKIS